MRLFRRKSLVVVSALAALGTGAGLTAAASPVAASPRLSALGSKQVPGVLAGLSRAHLLSAAPSSQVLSIGIGVAAPDTAGEKAAYAGMYDPTSPTYHHFLTPAQFDAAFGVSRSTRDAVTSWLRAGGLTVSSVSDDGLYVQATGTVAQLDKQFAVHIGSYADQQTGRFLANDVAPSVPAGLPITAVSGLDTVQHVTTAAAASGQQPKQLAATAATGDFNGVLTPQNLWSVYDQPATDEGQGQTIGIFGEGTTDPVVTQLRLFERRFGLPKIPVQTVYTQPGVAPDLSTTAGTGGDNGGNIEWYLDAQASTGMAPQAKELQLWFSNTLFDPDIAASISAWTATAACTASSPISTATTPACAPLEMNASFGECEAGAGNDATIPLSQLPYGTELGDALEPLADPMLLKATMMGRTLFASAGDTGSGCPEVALPVVGAGNGLADQPVPIANYPCASAYVTCVGGTVLHTDDPAGKGDADEGPTSTHNTRVDEISWETSGGGPSHYIQQPAYQKGISTITVANAPCLADYDGTPYPDAATTPCRVTPDVAALSGNSFGNGYFIYIDGAPSSEGGTSLSSPLTMGMWARLQAAASSPTGNGFANPTYYSHYGTADSSGNFFDVTCIEEDLMGGDPVCGSTGVSSANGVNRDGPGYDAVSGLGVPDIGKLLLAVDGTTTARTAATSPEGPQLVGSTVTMTSPNGNAQDPVANNPVRGTPAGGVGATLSLLPAVDETVATVTTSTDGKTVTATMSGPALSSTPDPQSGGSEGFVVYWYEAATHDVYYLKASTSASGVTYSAGDTADGFTTIDAATVTGTFTGGTLTMTAPLATLGAPAVGSLLEDPSSVTQVVVPSTPATNELDLTADTAAYLSPAVQSRGQAVCVGGCAATVPGSTTAPVSTSPGTSAGTSLTPTASSGGALAMTGLSVLVPVVALLLVGGGVGAAALRRRRAEG